MRTDGAIKISDAQVLKQVPSRSFELKIFMWGA
jgi:hypothetical protein